MRTPRIWRGTWLLSPNCFRHEIPPLARLLFKGPPNSRLDVCRRHERCRSKTGLRHVLTCNSATVSQLRGNAIGRGTATIGTNRTSGRVPLKRRYGERRTCRRHAKIDVNDLTATSVSISCCGSEALPDACFEPYTMLPRRKGADMRRDFITLIGSTAIGWARGAWEPRCTAAVSIALTVEVREPSCFSTAE